jgi:hypothetical protein
MHDWDWTDQLSHDRTVCLKNNRILVTIEIIKEKVDRKSSHAGTEQGLDAIQDDSKTSHRDI